MIKSFTTIKRGDSGTPIELLMALVFISIFVVGCTNVVNSNPFFHSDFDNSEKLKSFTVYLDKIEGGFLNIKEAPIVASTKDLFLFFSAGNEPIILTYLPGASKFADKKTNPNGDYIFERPDVPECKDKACICYSSGAKFWRQTENLPYITSVDLQTSFSDKKNPWSDNLIKCVSAPNPRTIFANSRGWDADFIKFKARLSPLEIPVSLQSSVVEMMNYIFTPVVLMHPGGTFSTPSTPSTTFGQALTTRRIFLKTNYYWKGGVVIGGMGVAQNKKEREEHILSVPLFNITFEKMKGTNVVGLCLQPKCLYSQGFAKAKEQEAQSTRVVLLFSDFKNLESYLNNDFPTCLVNNPDVDYCAKSLQTVIANVFINSQSKNNIIIDTSGATSKWILTDGSKQMSTIQTSFQVPQIDGAKQTQISITGQKNNQLMVNSKSYDLSLIKDGTGYLLNLIP